MTHDQQAATPPPVTWLSYCFVGLFSYVAVAIGPLLPELKNRLSLTYFQAGCVPATWALGITLAGFATDTFSRKFGTQRTLWSSATLLSVMAALFAAAPLRVLLFSSLFVAGLAGGTLLSVSSHILGTGSDKVRSRSIAEANVVAAIASVLAPAALAMVRLAGSPAPVAICIPGLVVLILALSPLNSRPDAQNPPAKLRAHRQGNLGSQFWLAWLLLVMAVGVEGSLNTWGPQYLRDGQHLTGAAVQAAPVVFYIAFLGSRILGTWLSARRSPAELLSWTLAMTITGVAIYAMSNNHQIVFAAYAVAGAGVANLWPWGLSVVIGAGAKRSLQEKAGSRASSAAGLASLILPPVLGGIADAVGIRSAQLALLVMVAMALALSVTIRTRRQHPNDEHAGNDTPSATNLQFTTRSPI